ncbi:pneumococcal-type histidine triad protein [Atopobacter phocae]|uniref:pneumococcal-type histidine triad protein n=1 Tax=Atopobacter phocae TaxID=136492 RepID=UPI0004701DBF|nr:pneumococcal-type histidine triad protein [Atopobacter phocae]
MKESNKKWIYGLSAAAILGAGSVYAVNQFNDQTDNKAVTTDSKSKVDYDKLAKDIEDKNKEHSHGDTHEEVVVEIKEDGYVTSHGNHYHYYKGKVPFDALISEELVLNDKDYKFSKDDVVSKVKGGYIIRYKKGFYLYLTDNKENNIKTKKEIETLKQTVENSPSKHDHMHGEDDGYEFNVKDIVSETADGYVVKHGDHFHYIYKKDVNRPNRSTQMTNNKKANNHHHTSDHHEEHDDYVFDMKDVIEETADGYVVKHGNHLHFIYKKDVSPNKPSKDKKPSVNIAHDSNHHNHDAIKPIEDDYVFDMKDVIQETKDGYIVKHGDHLHFIYKDKDKNKEHNHKDLDHDHDSKHEDHDHKHPESDHDDEKDHDDHAKEEKPLDSKLEERLQKIMKDYGIKREQIRIDEEANLIVYPHGTHYHAEPLDPNKLSNNNDHHHHHHHEEEPDTDPSIETHSIVGPIKLDQRSQLFKREQLITDYPALSEKIKDIHNFRMIGFFVAQEDSKLKTSSQLSLDGQPVDYMIYLVRKDLPWKDVTFKLPEVILEQDHYLKGWTYELPTEGIVKRDRLFSARIRPNRFKESPVVINPINADTLDPDSYTMADYIRISFHSLNYGSLKYEHHQQPNMMFWIKDTATWGEAKANGFSIPKPVPKPGFEFIDWGHGLPDDQDKVSTEIYTARFGVSSSILGPYVPKDLAHPLNETDEHRPHPKSLSLPYNPAKYATVAFKVEGNHGSVSDYFDQGKILTYLVRKDISQGQAFLIAPTVIPEEGYEFVGWDRQINPNENASNTLYTAKMRKVDPNKLGSNEDKGKSSHPADDPNWDPFDHLFTTPSEPLTDPNVSEAPLISPLAKKEQPESHVSTEGLKETNSEMGDSTSAEYTAP